MSIDPRIQTLFAQAEQVLDRDAFLRSVMRRIDRERRRSLLVWAALSIVMIAGLALLAPPVVTALEMATKLLPVSLVDIETKWLQLLLAPINTVAAAIAIGALARRSGATIPRWLNEGLAQYAEGRLFVDKAPDLAAKAFFGSLIPLDELDRQVLADRCVAREVPLQLLDRLQAIDPLAGGVGEILGLHRTREIDEQQQVAGRQ